MTALDDLHALLLMLRQNRVMAFKDGDLSIQFHPAAFSEEPAAVAAPTSDGSGKPAASGEAPARDPDFYLSSGG